MSILITGSSGFLGKNLCNALKIRSDVLTPSHEELDLLDYQKTYDYFRKGPPLETVVHCAGYVGGIGLNESEGSRMYSDNLLMGMNLIEALEGSPTHLILISTVCVYPWNAAVPTPETEIFSSTPPAKSTAAYGLAKRRLYKILKGSNVRYTYIVPTNMYGPMDHFEEHRSHVVPALIRRVHEAKEAQRPSLEVWGDPWVTRDLLYVEDACTAILKAAFSQPTNDIYNLSSGEETSIAELGQLISTTAEYWGELKFDSGKPTGAERRYLDSQKFERQFGWKPKVSLKEGIQRTYEWYTRSLAPG